MPGAIYSPFADRIHGHAGPLFPLHVGDTWRDPFVGARSEDIEAAKNPRLHAYCDTRGVPALLEAVREKLRLRNGLVHEPDEILITAGATGGLAALAGAALSPDDEILILAPFWPLIRGIAQSVRARPVEVPFFDRVDSLAEAVDAVASRITSKSRVLYVSTPSNPTGRMIPGDWLEALAAARAPPRPLDLLRRGLRGLRLRPRARLDRALRPGAHGLRLLGLEELCDGGPAGRLPRRPRADRRERPQDRDPHLLPRPGRRPVHRPRGDRARRGLARRESRGRSRGRPSGRRGCSGCPSPRAGPSSFSTCAIGSTSGA